MVEIFLVSGLLVVAVNGSHLAKQQQEQGINSEQLDSVICPIGLNIGAESPEEIAIAVTAQILSLAKGVSPADENWRQSL